MSSPTGHLRALEVARTQSRELNPLQRKMPPIVQLSLQFIRALRDQMLAEVSFYKALPRIRAMLEAYL